jgi:hypothetical protein
MAILFNGKTVLFNEKNPDFLFVKHLDTQIIDEECTEVTKEEWIFKPDNRTITRTITTKYAPDIYRRRRLPPFGKGGHTSSTTYGEEVFMEWNPMVFVTKDGSVHPAIKAYIDEYNQNGGYVRHKLILDESKGESKRHIWERCVDYQRYKEVARNAKTVQADKPILFRPEITKNQEVPARAPATWSQKMADYISSSNQQQQPAPIRDQRELFSIQHIKNKQNGGGGRFSKPDNRYSRTSDSRQQQERQPEVAFRLINFSSLIGVRPEEIREYLEEHGVESYMRVVIPRDRETGENKNKAFINFRSQEDLDAAYNILSSQRLIWGNAVINVEYFKPAE